MEPQDLERILNGISVHVISIQDIREKIVECYIKPPQLEDEIFGLQKKLDKLDLELTTKRAALVKHAKEFVDSTDSCIEDAFNSPQADEYTDMINEVGTPYVKTHNEISHLLEERKKVQSKQKTLVEEKGKLESYAQQLDLWLQKSQTYLDELKGVDEKIKSVNMPEEISYKEIQAYNLFESFVSRLLSKRRNLIEKLGIESTLKKQKRKRKAGEGPTKYIRSRVPIHDQIDEIVRCVLTYCNERLDEAVEYNNTFQDLMNQLGLLSEAQRDSFASASSWAKYLVPLVENPEKINIIKDYVKTTNNLQEQKSGVILNLYQHVENLKSFFEN